jgi:hypothetical protein
MNDEEKLLWMFEQVHGKMSLSCYAEVDAEEGTVSCMKDGNVCWTVTKADLVFDYIMKDKTI